jgi:Zn-dependent peptidase ImmA (M78 family)
MAAKKTVVKYPKMPTKVKIGSQNWTIEERTIQTDGVLDDNAYGYTLKRGSLIVIDKDATPSRKRQTLWHELMHAVRSSLGSIIVPKTTDNEQEDSNSWEHYFIGMYEEGLLLIIRENPDVVNYLLSLE